MNIDEYDWGINEEDFKLYVSNILESTDTLHLDTEELTKDSSVIVNNKLCCAYLLENRYLDAFGVLDAGDFFSGFSRPALEYATVHALNDAVTKKVKKEAIPKTLICFDDSLDGLSYELFNCYEAELEGLLESISIGGQDVKYATRPKMDATLFGLDYLNSHFLQFSRPQASIIRDGIKLTTALERANYENEQYLHHLHRNQDYLALARITKLDKEWHERFDEYKL